MRCQVAKADGSSHICRIVQQSLRLNCGRRCTPQCGRSRSRTLAATTSAEGTGIDGPIRGSSKSSSVSSIRDRKPVKDAELRAFPVRRVRRPRSLAPTGSSGLRDVPVGALTLEARADGFHAAAPDRGGPRPGPSSHARIAARGRAAYKLGDSRLAFVPDPTAVLVRARGPEAGREFLGDPTRGRGHGAPSAASARSRHRTGQ